MTISLFFLCLMAASASAGTDAEKIIGKLQKKYKSVKDATVSFTQDIQFGVTKAKQSFSGKFTMKSGNKYRIDLENETIVTDGSTVWHYTGINKQVIIDKYRDDPDSFSPDKVLVNVPDNYEVALLGKEKLKGKEMDLLKFLPRKKDSNLKWLKIWVDEDGWTMIKIQLLDSNDNIITYDILDIKLNSGIPESLFTFEVPKGVEAIDLR
jgi:chaperone LolA